VKSSVKLGKIAGIPIGLHYTWFIIFILVTVSLAIFFFPATYPLWSTSVYWIVGIATSLLFFASVVAHELAHSLVARRFGVPVRDITLFLFGGVAAITKEVERPVEELLMAISGPLTSLVLSGLFQLLGMATSARAEPVAAGAFYLAGINLALAIFNLLPGFPMDGGRVFRAIVWAATGNYQKSTRIAAWLGQAFAYLMIIGGVVMVLMGNFDGLWLALIGWFIDNAASASYRQVRLQEQLRGHTAAELMRTECASVPADTSLATLVNSHILPEGQRCFLVTDHDELKGLVTLHEVKQVPKDKWPTTDVGHAMTQMDSLLAVSPDTDAYTVLERMSEKDVNQIPVVSEGHLVGIIARDSILRFIQAKTDLGV